MAGKICARCGKNEGDGDEFYGSFCATCRADSKIPDKMQILIKRCPKCGRVKYETDFLDERKGIESAVLSQLRKNLNFESAEMKIEKISEKEARATANAVFEIDGKIMNREIPVNAKIQKHPCTECRKMSARYHEAIIQVRGTEKKVERFVNNFQGRVEEAGGMVTGLEEQENGVDILVSDKTLAMKVAMSLHMPYVATRKQMGIRKGTHVFKITFCYKL